MTIGRTLAEAREKAGMSVDEVAAATRIRRTLVMGIEGDDFSGCGGDFYARGHVRSIAQKVGVDPRPLLAEFDSRPGRNTPRATEVFESETAARAERRGPNWSAAMAVALVLVLAYGVFQVVTAEREDPRLVGGSRERPTAVASSTPTPATSSAPESSAVAKAPRNKVTVAVRTDGTSWVQATAADGEALFEGLLTDETRSFSHRRQVRLVIGNAGAVSLTVNGTAIGSPGRAGQVARVAFTPEDPAGG